jgi:hypothetical protein
MIFEARAYDRERIGRVSTEHQENRCTHGMYSYGSSVPFEAAEGIGRKGGSRV